MMTSGSGDEGALSSPEGGKIPPSNVAGKKLIRGAREIRLLCGELEAIEDPEKKAAFLREKVVSWQDKGIDGVMFFLRDGHNAAPGTVNSSVGNRAVTLVMDGDGY